MTDPTQKAPALPARLAAWIRDNAIPMSDELGRICDEVDRLAAKEPVLPPDEPVAFVNGDELDNMIEPHNHCTIAPKPDGWRKTPLYTRAALPAADTVLRWAVKRMAYLLANNEWAEHVSSDPDVMELESQITKLIAAPDVNGAVLAATKQGADNE